MIPEPSLPLAGRSALVTGAGRGIGRAIALELAAAGAGMVLAALERDELEGVAAEVRALGREALVHPCDVAEEAQVDALAAAAQERFGRIDVLVNNAGTLLLPGDLAGTGPAAWDRTMAVNVRGAYLAIRALLPQMQAHGEGRIVNIASTAGLRGLPERTAYCASKHALVGLTRALAVDLRGGRVTVNAVCPGAVDTPLTALSRPEADRSRWLRPEDVARVVAFLAGPGGSTVHGAVIELDDRSS